jgi:hypothetical protein
VFDIANGGYIIGGTILTFTNVTAWMKRYKRNWWWCELRMTGTNTPHDFYNLFADAGVNQTYVGVPGEGIDFWWDYIGPM